MNLKTNQTKDRKARYSINGKKLNQSSLKNINNKKALNIQEPEPLIIIPENLAPFIPRTTDFLTKYKQSDLNFNAYLRYRNLMSEVLLNVDKVEELRNSKAGVGRTLKQLQILYDNNDIDINSFTELYEKYSIKLETIESAIQNLINPQKNNKRTKQPNEILNSIM